ncbi:carbohydrate ABC transporter permease [Rugosimonospora africana]|uniref:ABC transporter permease n=1 Tax=Rugosimonospora africana TaxID=556532 RepID=A0A8J3QW73_9ACTN|nr:sugar ABC transporter permease [Rugosimonospora africana]GIH17504.1 ABC transporter permease [Rugosimonospora africana]
MTTVTTPAAGPGTAAGGKSASTKKRRRRRVKGNRATPYLMLLLAIILELLVHIIPMITGVWMSLRGLTQFYIRNWSAAPFVGLGNFRVTLDFNSPIGGNLAHSLGVTAGYSALTVGFCWLFGITAGVLLQRPFRGRGLLRTVFLAPYALPAYAAVITWSFMLQRDTGAVNHVLVDELHLFHSRPFWLIGGNSFVSLVVVSVWRTWPFALLVLTAGLQTIPGELYEAAAMDGAGFMRQLRSITLPMLRPVNQVLLLVLFLWSFNDFNTPYVLFGSAAPHAADLISIHIYQSSFVTWNFGLGSAMSVLLLLFLLVVTAVYLYATSRRRNDA